MYDFIVIGGGAAGFFAAITAKKTNPQASVLLIEKTAVLLSKVRISGGGRCNVTHSCFDPKILVQNYPRGNKELLGPFYTFGPQETIDWFQSRGVTLKTEKDGRIFPTTDSSETIIQCLLSEAKKLGVEIALRTKVQEIKKSTNGFILEMKDSAPIECGKLVLATGSGSQGFSWAQELGHSIINPVPSLFTFNVPSSPLKDLSGIAVSDCILRLKGSSQEQRGVLLITHFGFSGPVALKLSAWAAPFLHETNYRAELVINWLPKNRPEELISTLIANKNALSSHSFGLPKNLWKDFVKTVPNVSNKAIIAFAEKLQNDSYQVEGKTTNKEEFVTCGGVDLREVNFKTMESKICPHLYFAGEILNIDGVTGGFNFQNAWTTGFLAGKGLQFT